MNDGRTSRCVIWLHSLVLIHLSMSFYAISVSMVLWCIAPTIDLRCSVTRFCCTLCSLLSKCSNCFTFHKHSVVTTSRGCCVANPFSKLLVDDTVDLSGSSCMQHLSTQTDFTSRLSEVLLVYFVCDDWLRPLVCCLISPARTPPMSESDSHTDFCCICLFLSGDVQMFCYFSMI
jgi:hypothetical protein